MENKKLNAKGKWFMLADRSDFCGYITFEQRWNQGLISRIKLKKAIKAHATEEYRRLRLQKAMTLSEFHELLDIQLILLDMEETQKDVRLTIYTSILVVLAIASLATTIARVLIVGG